MTAVARSFLALTGAGEAVAGAARFAGASIVGRDPIDGEREPERREAELAMRRGRCAG